MSATLPYRTLAPYLRQRFGRPVHRIALDAGSTCPNRDRSSPIASRRFCSGSMLLPSPR